MPAAFRAASSAGSGQTVGVNSLSITIPAAAQVGDVAILSVHEASTATTLSTPAGWNLRKGPDVCGTSTSQTWIFTKTLASGNPGSQVTLSFGNFERALATMLVFSTVTETGIEIPTPVQETTITGTPATPTQTGVPAGAAVSVFALRRNPNNTGVPVVTLPSGWTQDVNISTNYGSATELTSVAGHQIASTSGSYGGTNGSSNPTSFGNEYIVVLPTTDSTLTVNAGGDRSDVEPWSQVNFTCTGNFSGTAIDYTVTQTAGTGVTFTGDYPGATMSYIAPGTLAGETGTFSVVAHGINTSSSDVFTGTTGAAWSSLWTKETAQAGSTVDISSNSGRQVTSTGANKKAAAYASTAAALSDCDLVVDVTMSSTLVEQYVNISLRGDGTNNTANTGKPGKGYGLVLQYGAASSSFIIEKYSGTTFSTVVTAQPISLAGGTKYRVRFRAVAGTLYVRIWDASGTEPGAWTYKYTDPSPYLTAGKPRLAIGNGSDGVARTGLFDNFTYSSVTQSAADTVNVAVLKVTERAVVSGAERPAEFTHASSTPAPPPPPALTRPDIMGLALEAGQLQFNTATTDAILDEAVNLGVKWIRTDCNWSWVEGTQGSLNWTWMDYIRTGCKNRGLNMVWCVGTMPAWARQAGQPETYGPTTTTEQTNFANFVTSAVNRYKADVHYWEVWNEPNLNQFWTPTPNVTTYASLLAKVYASIKAADPTATVLSGATGGAGASPDISSTTWWTNLYAAGAKSNFDIAAHHPYIDPAQAVNGVYNTGEMFNATAIRNTMNSNGDSAKPLWATECGVPTSGSQSVTEAQQATTIAALRDLWFSRESGTKVFWFTLTDTKAYGASGSTREDFFGWDRSDYGHKPVFTDEQTWIASA